TFCSPLYEGNDDFNASSAARALNASSTFAQNLKQPNTLQTMRQHMGTVRQRIGAVFKRRAAAAAPSYKLLNPRFGELFDYDDDDFDFNAPNNKLKQPNTLQTMRQRIGADFK